MEFNWTAGLIAGGWIVGARIGWWILDRILAERARSRELRAVAARDVTPR